MRKVSSCRLDLVESRKAKLIEKLANKAFEKYLALEKFEDRAELSRCRELQTLGAPSDMRLCRRYLNIFCKDLKREMILSFPHYIEVAAKVIESTYQIFQRESLRGERERSKFIRQWQKDLQQVMTSAALKIGAIESIEESLQPLRAIFEILSDLPEEGQRRALDYVTEHNLIYRKISDLKSEDVLQRTQAQLACQGLVRMSHSESKLGRSLLRRAESIAGAIGKLAEHVELFNPISIVALLLNPRRAKRHSRKNQRWLCKAREKGNLVRAVRVCKLLLEEGEFATFKSFFKQCMKEAPGKIVGRYLGNPV